MADQAAAPPYGTNLTFPLEEYTHLHLTSGTVGEQLRVLQTAEDWRPAGAASPSSSAKPGVTSADRVALPFPFGAYLQFWAAAAGSRTSAHSRFRWAVSRAASACGRSPSSRPWRSSAHRRMPLA